MFGFLEILRFYVTFLNLGRILNSLGDFFLNQHPINVYETQDAKLNIVIMSSFVTFQSKPLFEDLVQTDCWCVC